MTPTLSGSGRLFSSSINSPILLAPVGSQKAFHADGELASARAAKAQGNLQMLSNVSSHSIEDVIDARGEPVWFQLYPTNKWSTAKTMLLRAQDAGAKVVVLTVDLNVENKRVLLGQFSILRVAGLASDVRRCCIQKQVAAG